MHVSLLLLGSLGLASARVHPYMYGVPVVEAGIDDIPTDFMEAAFDNTTSPLTANSTSSLPAFTTPTPTAPATPGFAEPCAVISSAIKAMPSNARKVVPAELGMRCLESVPLDKAGNVKLIDDLKLYLAWQSNLAYLKNPPPEYTEVPVS
jgi:hypothetical protein